MIFTDILGYNNEMQIYNEKESHCRVPSDRNIDIGEFNCYTKQ